MTVQPFAARRAFTAAVACLFLSLGCLIPRPAAGRLLADPPAPDNDGGEGIAAVMGRPSEGPAVLRQQQQQQRTVWPDLVGNVSSALSEVMEADPDLRPAVVRLAFHDCVDGCDGCVDMSDMNNAGLDVPIDALAPVAEAFGDDMSRADLWALAGLVAARDAQNPLLTSNAFDFEFFGRENCEGGPKNGPAQNLPLPTEGSQYVAAYFHEQLGLTPKETVALMGAHTLGRATFANSGYEGSWIPMTNQVLDNGFFMALNYDMLVEQAPGSSTWVQGPVVPPAESAAAGVEGAIPEKKYQWTIPTAKSDFVMLNADIALVRDFADHVVDPATGEVSCDLHSKDNLCPPSPAEMNEAAVLYSGDTQTWVDDFEPVFKKMMLKVPEGVTLRPVRQADMQSS